MGWQEDWITRYLPKFNPRLMVLRNEFNGCWEVWQRRAVWVAQPKNVEEAWLLWEKTPKYYHRLFECRGPAGEPIPVGPWLLELLDEYDLRKKGEDNLHRFWARKEAEKQKAKERVGEEFKDEVKHYERAIVRGLEGKASHGGVVQVPR